MTRLRSTSRINLFWLLPIALGVYWFYAFTAKTIDYTHCELCDGHEYAKLYQQFETGEGKQIAFPYHSRPLVPFTAALYPGSDIAKSFHSVNFVFIVFGVIMLFFLWRYLDIAMPLHWLGFFWLGFHWVGLIRYNLADYISVDVPIYGLQALGIYLFLKKKYIGLYILGPIAVLQKESFLAILLIFVAIAILFEYLQDKRLSQSLHLVGVLFVTMLIRLIALDMLPDQMDQRSSLMTIVSAMKLIYIDPIRPIRLFAALGSAFGLFPVLAILRFRKTHLLKRSYTSLYALSILYLGFGILAGEDMTRILFLGFPFIMTVVLLSLRHEHWSIILVTTALSIPVMHIFPISIQINWAVDFAPMTYVLKWAAYFVVCSLVLVYFVRYMDKRPSLNVISKAS